MGCDKLISCSYAGGKAAECDTHSKCTLPRDDIYSISKLLE